MRIPIPVSFAKKKFFIPTGSERTAGKIDVKEGIYFGPDASFDDPDVISGTPMVGPNQYPDERDLPDFANAVKQYRDQMKTVGCVHTKLLVFSKCRSRGHTLTSSHTLFVF